MDDGYKVGYGKPPRTTQFVKGKSGNPRGRPKKVGSPVETELESLLADKCGTAVVGTETKEVSGEEFMVRGLVLAALKRHSVKAASQLLLRELQLKETLINMRAYPRKRPEERGFYLMPEDMDLERFEQIAMVQQAKLIAATRDDREPRT